jgi:hypothetical protein
MQKSVNETVLKFTKKRSPTMPCSMGNSKRARHDDNDNGHSGFNNINININSNIYWIIMKDLFF